MTGSKWLIAGLGNPGRPYERTWHNSGYQVLDRVARLQQLTVDRVRFRSLTAEWRTDEATCLLLKPLTYMNLSGEAISEAARYFQIPPMRILVVYDDIDLPFGNIRIRARGGPGTHNGMRSIAACLGTQDFPRIRLGIGPKPDQWALADYVLSQVPAEAASAWDQQIDQAARAVMLTAREGLAEAISRYNAR